MNVSLFLVILLAAFTCGGKKKKKGKKININSLFQSVLRTPPKPAAPTTQTTTVPPTTTAASTIVAPTTSDLPEYTGVVLKSFNTSDIKSDEDLFKMLNISLPKQPDGGNSQGGSQGSSASSGACSQVACTMRPTVVKFKDPGFGYSFFPPCAVVNRCTGCCFARSHSCQPTATRMTTVNSVLIKLGMNMESMTLLAGSSFTFQRVQVPIEEHLDCNCDCNSSVKCDSRLQNYDIGRCGCVCKTQYRNLDCKGHFKYDPGKCKCVCAKTKEDCKHNWKWSIDDCQCVCSNSKCPPYQSRHPSRNCDCV